MRVVSGTALYSSAFTPSISPLTVVPNTTLLACQSPSVVSNALIATTWTKAGTTSVQKFSPFGSVTVPKYFSAYFNGSANSLTFTGNTSTRVTGGDWTFEAWIYLSSSNTETYPPILKDTSASWGLPLLLAGSTNGNKVLNCQVGSSTSASGPSYVTVDTWHHVASVRSGTTITVYLDGVPGTPITNDITLSTTPTWVIGSDGSTRYFNGYISNLRIVKGQALYTGTFTPSTSPLTATTVGATGAGAAASITGTVSLLTCQSNTFVDNSTNSFAITATTATVKPLPISPFAVTASSKVSYSPRVFGGSMYFDGDSDYLTIPGSALFNLGSSTSTPWTVECWVYQLAAKTTNFVSQGAAVWRISIGTDAKVSWVFGGSSVQTATDAIQYNAWNHLAFSYDGTYSGTSNKEISSK